MLFIFIIAVIIMMSGGQGGRLLCSMEPFDLKKKIKQNSHPGI
jgi:hypothetical protein